MGLFSKKSTRLSCDYPSSLLLPQSQEEISRQEIVEGFNDTEKAMEIGATICTLGLNKLADWVVG